MARRKNPWATFALFLGVVGFGFASWHFLYEQKLFATDTTPTPPGNVGTNLRKMIDELLSDDELYMGIVSFSWREQTKRYRVDVMLRDGSSKDKAKELCGRVTTLVGRVGEGAEAEISCLVLGQEIYHFVP